eukprot:4779-Amorphochlora_amoeboformis.AAC.1
MALHVAYRNQPKPKPKQLKSDDDKKNNPTPRQEKGTPRQEKGTPRQEKGTFAGCFVMSSYLHDDSLLYKNSEDQGFRLESSFGNGGNGFGMGRERGV